MLVQLLKLSFPSTSEITTPKNKTKSQSQTKKQSKNYKSHLNTHMPRVSLRRRLSWLIENSTQEAVEQYTGQLRQTAGYHLQL
jgi:hypothetical protein